jgi:hypothetical protein
MNDTDFLEFREQNGWILVRWLERHGLLPQATDFPIWLVLSEFPIKLTVLLKMPDVRGEILPLAAEASGLALIDLLRADRRSISDTFPRHPYEKPACGLFWYSISTTRGHFKADYCAIKSIPARAGEPQMRKLMLGAHAARIDVKEFAA